MYCRCAFYQLSCIQDEKRTEVARQRYVYNALSPQTSQTGPHTIRIEWAQQEPYYGVCTFLSAQNHCADAIQM